MILKTRRTFPPGFFVVLSVESFVSGGAKAEKAYMALCLKTNYPSLNKSLQIVDNSVHLL